MLSSPEEAAVALSTALRAGVTDPESLAQLAGARRPYFAWALAWAEWTGAAERAGDDGNARRAVEALRALESEASRLDGAYLTGT